MAIATSTAMLIAAGVAAAGTAATLSAQHQAGKAQQSAAEAAARTQQQAFEASQQAFASLAVPEPEAIKDQAKAEALRRKQQQALTILTSPVGIVGEPNIARKTLLGQ